MGWGGRRGNKARSGATVSGRGSSSQAVRDEQKREGRATPPGCRRRRTRRAAPGPGARAGLRAGPRVGAGPRPGSGPRPPARGLRAPSPRSRRGPDAADYKSQEAQRQAAGPGRTPGIWQLGAATQRRRAAGAQGGARAAGGGATWPRACAGLAGGGAGRSGLGRLARRLRLGPSFRRAAHKQARRGRLRRAGSRIGGADLRRGRGARAARPHCPRAPAPGPGARASAAAAWALMAARRGSA